MNFIMPCKVPAATLGLLFSLLLTLPVDVHAKSDYRHIQSLSTASHPAALAVDSKENLYVLYTGGNRLSMYDSRGRHVRNLSGLGTPVSVAIGPDDRILIGSLDKKSVSVYNSNLQLLYHLGKGQGEFERPISIAVAADGTVYVADAGTDQIKVYGSRGASLFTFGSSGSGDGSFNSPTALDIAEDTGELIVTDLKITKSVYGPHHGARIQVFDLKGKFRRSFGDYEVGNGGLIKPLGLTVDSAGQIMVADAYQNVVQVFGTRGEYRGAIYDQSSPMKTTLDVASGPVTGRVFITSYNADSVEVYERTGTAAGLAFAAASSEKAAVSALSSEPLDEIHALEVDVQGQGRVTSSSGGIDCRGTCQAQYKDGSAAFLTAVPDSGQRFVGWDGACRGTGYSCSVTMDGTHSVSAFFLPDNGAVASAAADFFSEDPEATVPEVDGAALSYVHVEDFESGDFSNLPWLTGRSNGEGGWIVQQRNSYEGNYAAQAPGDLAEGETGYLEMRLATVEEDALSFRFKLAPSGGSALTFKIDDQIAGSWSGLADWTTASFVVESGSHTLRWEYSGTGMGEGALLDEIFLPAHAEISNPVPDIKVNGRDDVCSLSPEDPVLVTVGISAGFELETEADWWLALETPEGWQSYNAERKSWAPGLFPAYEGPLLNIVEHQTVLDAAELPADFCTFYFGVDLDMDNSMSKPFFYDSVSVQVTD